MRLPTAIIVLSGLCSSGVVSCASEVVVRDPHPRHEVVVEERRPPPRREVVVEERRAPPRREEVIVR